MQRKEVVPGHATPAKAGVSGAAAEELHTLLTQVCAVTDRLDPKQNQPGSSGEHLVVPAVTS